MGQMILPLSGYLVWAGKVRATVGRDVESIGHGTSDFGSEGDQHIQAMIFYSIQINDR